MPDVFRVGPQPGQKPSLQYRLAMALDALRGRFPQSTPATPVTATPEVPIQVKSDETPVARGYPDANYISSVFRQWDELFRFGTTRQRRYREYEEMDTDQIAAILDSIVASCLVSEDGEQFGFKVEAKAKYQGVIDQICHDLNLESNILTVLRDMLKYGDAFVGLVLDEGYNLRDLELPPAEQMWVFVDDHMRLLPGYETLGAARFPRAYQQKNAAMATVAGWFPWEMFHLKFMPHKRAIYSLKSFLEDYRVPWHKMKIIEEAMVINRATRSTPRLAHSIDVTSKSKDEAVAIVRDYARQLSSKKLSGDQYVKDIPEVDEDLIYSSNYRTGPDGKLYPSLNSLTLLDPRNTSLRLDDVTHLQRKLFSRIPGEVVGILPDRNDISQQDLAASKLYHYCQRILKEQLLRPLFDYGLMLKGYRPEPEDYRILMVGPGLKGSWRYADAEFRLSMAQGNHIEQKLISRETLAKQKFGWTDEEWKAEVARMEKEAKTFGPPPDNTASALIRHGNNSQ